jgi:hypothetical protein
MNDNIEFGEGIMKTLWLLLALISFAPLARAEVITCNGGKAQFTRLSKEQLGEYKNLKSSKAVFRVLVAETFSIPLLGAITSDDDRLISFGEEKSNGESAILSDWDGSSGVEITLPKALVDNSAGFEGKTISVPLYVYYDHNIEDHNNTELNCTVK